MRNRHVRSTLRTTLKRIEEAISRQDRDAAGSLLTKTLSGIDRAATKGVIHRNKAARHASRITRKVNALLSSSTS